MLRSSPKTRNKDLGRSMGRSFFTHALKHKAPKDPDNRDVEQLGLIRLCGQCSAWHIPIIGITPKQLLKGIDKKRPTHAPFYFLSFNFLN